nr:hypothetical protein [Enterobacter pasteurii]
MSLKKMIKRSIAAWVAVCLISGVLLYAEQIRRQYWERDREFTARYSAIGAVLTQNESVLPLLSGDEDITALRKKFPSVLALEKTAGRALDAPRVEPFSGVRYWLYNPWRQIRVLVDLSALVPARHSFAQLHLNVTNGDGPPSSGAFWRWQRAFPQHTQPFVLTAEAEPDWFSVSLLPYLLLFLTWGG